jgi:hypothetical protein
MATMTAPPFEEKRKGLGDRRKWHSVGVLTLYGPGPLHGTGYNLKQAILLQIQLDEGQRFVVSETNTGAFTSDTELPRAVANFFGAFIEEFDFLSQRESSLSPAMISDLERFRMLIEKSEK